MANAFSSITERIGGRSEKTNTYLHFLVESIEPTKPNSSFDTKCMINHFTKEERSISPKRAHTTIATHEAHTLSEKGYHAPLKEAKNISKRTPGPLMRKFR